LGSKNIETQIDDFLASVYVPSHSSSTVKCYKLAIKHFSEFVELKHKKSLEQVLKLIEKETLDQYDLLREFSVHLDKNLSLSFHSKIRHKSSETELRHK